MTTHPKYRPDIDGLRAVAVLSVLFFHSGFGAFSGGYVGVDVFFVISGYLITTIIVREIAAGVVSPDAKAVARAAGLPEPEDVVDAEAGADLEASAPSEPVAAAEASPEAPEAETSQAEPQADTDDTTQQG